MVNSSEAKLARAASHLADVEMLVSGFLRDEPFAIKGVKSDSGFETHLVVRRAPPDFQLGPRIGDVVHNLGSALDAIAWDIASSELAAGPMGYPAEPDAMVRFPIYLDDTPPARRRLRRALRPFPPHAAELIERLQPVETGDSGHPLWILDSLWSGDKHRGLHQTKPIIFHGDGGTSIPHPPLSYEAPLEMMLGSRTHGDPLEGWHDVRFGLGFSPPRSFPGRYPQDGLDVAETLQRILIYVRSEVVRPLRSLLNSA